MAEAGPIKMNWWYEMILNWMIQNPDGYLYECAREMGVTQGWLSCIIHSDAFQSAYKLRMGEHFNNTSFTVVRKMEGLALQSAELIAERLEREGETMPIGQLQSTAELALKALGFTASHGRDMPAPQQHNTQVNVYVADRQALAEARDKMRVLTTQSRPVLEAQESSDDPGEPHLKVSAAS